MVSPTIKAGERVYHRQAGAGGWGDPLDRSPAAVADDVRNGKVSVEVARVRHGVVIADEASGAVDEAATQTRRREMRSSLDAE